jgi:hypothetical protein
MSGHFVSNTQIGYEPPVTASVSFGVTVADSVCLARPTSDRLE